MRLLIAQSNYREAQSVVAYFKKHYGCTASVTNRLEEIGPYLSYVNHSAALVAPEYIDAFNKAARDVEVPISRIELTQGERGLSEDFARCVFARTAGVYGHNKSHILCIGGVELDMMGRKSCGVSGETIKISPKEHAFLRLLMLNAGRLVDRDTHILSSLYDGAEPQPQIIQRFASYLNKKITPPTGANSFINNKRGGGYFVSFSEGKANPIFTYGPVSFYPDASVTYNGQPLELPPSEKRILRILAENPQTIFSKDKLLWTLHPYETDVSSDIATSYMSRLRQKIAAITKSDDAPYGMSVIENIRGSGYRWQDPMPLEPPDTSVKRQTFLKEMPHVNL